MAEHQAPPIAEEKRNRLLRRVDWRFLLGQPEFTFECSVCLADGDLAAGVELISRRRATLDSLRPEEADLAVAVNPSSSTLRDLWTALRPGGACYTEWRAPLVQLRRVRQMLEQAGFVDVRVYWCWPRADRALFWLPLDSPAGLRKFLASRRLAPRKPVRKLMSIVYERLWHLARSAGLLQPLRVTARKPGSASMPSGCSNALDDIRTRWSTWGFGHAPDQVSLVMLTAGRRSINKAVALVSAEPDGSARVALKMARVAESRDSLTHEARTLAVLEQRAAGRLTGVPRLLLFHERSGAVAESVVSGVPLVQMLDTQNVEPIARAATRWLENLAGRIEPQPPSAWKYRLVQPVVNEFAEAWRPVLDQSMLRTGMDAIERLGALPLVCEQRDFAPWNVLRTREGDLAVLDWEGAEVDGMPARDLFYFLSQLGFLVEDVLKPGGDTRGTYRRMLRPDTRLGLVRAECIASYLDTTGVSESSVPALSMLTWMLHAGSEYRRLVADAGGPPSEAAMRSSVFLGLWQEDVRTYL